ncbi:hypothetical protein ABEV74_02995 [Paenibacillus cisolokensis]|uniref:YfhD family protein n=1 Tax=Paenibacillus cisolokensis TaxID=1658519 RepID=A0ABQ4N5A3_9BACL|nr:MULTISPECIES: hypothetical protein [Paenibacillus]ALS27106.1 hypothetical protein IJ21_17050 [Paenibacillus sp. 32O-W]GIQ63344.1 hypothetical protein PACILC2_19120 [Paenibacillus cisolokensis]
MAKSKRQPSKAEVQTTKLNKLPVPDSNDTEFSAEAAAEAFENNRSADRSPRSSE